MKIKIYAPVVIPTLNRYDHFRECLESLEKCTWADKTDVFVAFDYPTLDSDGTPSKKYLEGWQKIDKYLQSKERDNSFHRLIVVRRDHNYGVCKADANDRVLIREHIYHNYDRYIYSEDDNVFAPCFLDFMNKALEKYIDDPKISSVCGYNFISFDKDQAYKTYTCYDNCAWGFGLWVPKEKKIEALIRNAQYFRQVAHSTRESKKITDTYPTLYSMLLDMVSENCDWGDIKRTTINILNETYQIRPTISLVENNGFDGSGVHCGTLHYAESCEMAIENIYDSLDIIDEQHLDIVKNSLYKKGLDEANIQHHVRGILKERFWNTTPILRTRFFKGLRKYVWKIKMLFQ